MSRGPDELRLLLIDAKRVEFAPYHALPHLLQPVVTDHEHAVSALNLTLTEMNRRYKLLQAAQVRNIGEYNSRNGDLRSGQRTGAQTPDDKTIIPKKLPYIVLVINEIADLMSTGGEIENLLVRLTQLSDAVGIHAILATRSASVTVLTERIQSSFPCRIAFRVSRRTDSRTILDCTGAESLIGRGDMLFLHPKNGHPLRIQGAIVTNDEVLRITDSILASSVNTSNMATMPEHL